MKRAEVAHTPAASHPESWRSPRVELIAIVGFWTFFAVLMSANRILDPRGPGLQGGLPTAPIALAFFESYLWAALTPFVFWLTGRFGVERSNWAARVLLFLAVGVGLAVFVDVAVDLFRSEALQIPRRRAPDASPLRSITRLWFLNDLIVYVAVLAAGFAREYFFRYRTRQEEAVHLQAHAARLQAQLAEARLEALRMQLDPHFLFNTLHAVSTLVERDPRGVRRMISRLSELLRHTLDRAREPEVPLERELDFLRRYLEIMQIRFQGRLEAELHAGPGVQQAWVPSLILQPLVENAIKHGVGKMEGVGRVDVSAERAGDRLVLRVRDNGPGLTGVQVEEGVGLRNARERLGQLYGADQSLALLPAEDGGLVAEVSIPYHTGADLRTTALPHGS